MTNDEIRERFKHGSDQFAELRDMLVEIEKKLEPIPQMKNDLASTKEIVQAWAALKTGGRFLRWLAGVIASVIAIYTAIKLGGSELFK